MKKSAHLIVISSTILLLFVVSTNPQNLPSVLLVVPFLLLFCVLFAIAWALLGTSEALLRKRIKIGTVMAAVPVFLLVLQSLGQLTIRDVIAMVTIFAVAYFYMTRVGVRVTNRT